MIPIVVLKPTVEGEPFLDVVVLEGSLDGGQGDTVPERVTEFGCPEPVEGEVAVKVASVAQSVEGHRTRCRGGGGGEGSEML